MELKRAKPPNPNGNPNFKKLWGNLGEAKAVRLPESLHSLFRSLSTAINSGKIKVTDLENMCIDWNNVERQLTAITGKPSLTVVPDPIPTDDSHAIALKLIEQFEEEQRKSWGKAAKQTGEFNTNSPRWTKYNDFKAWVKSNA
jgi:hypothetical protein